MSLVSLREAQNFTTVLKPGDSMANDERLERMRQDFSDSFSLRAADDVRNGANDMRGDP